MVGSAGEPRHSGWWGWCPAHDYCSSAKGLCRCAGIAWDFVALHLAAVPDEIGGGPMLLEIHKVQVYPPKVAVHGLARGCLLLHGWCQ